MAEHTQKPEADKPAASTPGATANAEKADAAKANGPSTDGGARAGADKRDPAASELAALREKLETAEKTRDEYLRLAKSARADFENYQIRARRDQAEERRFAQMPLAHDLLAPLDNLERATAAARQSGDAGVLVQGVTMVVSQLLDVLRRHGITPINAQDQPFDPNLHQAVMQLPTADHPPNTVVQVLEQGYMMHDRVLRPARVAVSASPEPAKA
jgi:molecular chaperone GrpE